MLIITPTDDKELHMRRKRLLSAIGIMLLVMILPVSAIDLQNLVEQAKVYNPTMKAYRLNKEQAELRLQLYEAEKVLSIGVSGAMTVNRAKLALAGPTEAVLTVDPKVSFVLPNDEGTTITFSPGGVVKSFESKDWAVAPSLEASHTFSLGSFTSLQKSKDDLTISKQKMSADLAYLEGNINFENSVYQKIIEIIKIEQEMLQLQSQIVTQQTKMENDLKLKVTTKDASAYKSMEISLAEYQFAYQGAQRRYDLAKKQFTQLTGQQWEPIDTIGDADITLKTSPLGNMTVILADMDLQIAMMEYEQEQQKAANTLSVSGSLGLDHSDFGNTTDTSYNINAGTQYVKDNFQIGAVARLGISNTGTLTPSLTVNGSWKNKTTVESDRITLLELANTIELKEIQKQKTLQDYLNSVDQMETEILNYQISLQQFEQSAAYHKEVLILAEERFTRGLGTESQVNNAKLSLEIDAYQQQIQKLNALILANKIRLLQQ